MPLPTPEGPDMITGRRSAGSVDAARRLVSHREGLGGVDVLGAIVTFRIGVRVLGTALLSIDGRNEREIIM